MQNIADVYRVSPRQQDMLAALAAPGDPGRLVGQVAWTGHRVADPALLGRAFALVIARHPTLRTAVFTEGMEEPLQAVRGEVPLHWESRDWSEVPEAERAVRLAELAEAERTRGFDPAAAPLMRVSQVRLGPDSYRFLWSWSALVLDARSATLALEEVLETYRALRAGEEPAAPKPAPYRGYVAWLERQDAAAAAAFWGGRLAGAAPTRLGSGAAGEPRFRVQQAHLGMAETERLGGALQQHKLGWGAVAAGCWALLLHARAGAGEAVFGVGVTGRPGGLVGADAVLGGFRNTLPLRVPVDPGAELVPWLRSVQRAQDELRPFEHAGLAQLRGWAGLPPGAPLFESALEVHVPGDADPLAKLFGGLAFLDVERTDPSDGFPLEVRVVAGQEAAVRVRYDEARVSPVAVAEALAGFRALLDAVGAAPERRVGALLAGLASAPRARAGVSADDQAALVEAVLAQNPAVERVAVEREGAGLVARIAGRPEALARDRGRKRLSFSLFYFADAGNDDGADKYRIYLEGGQFADRHGFEAVWAPERHFHENGGLYPNPSVLSAALAPLTKRVGLRAGSVALPLHHPLRVAEEWSVVDNLSRGRAGISVTSGWIPNDFALAPHNFPNKRDVMFRMIEEVRELWRGGTLPVKDGAGKDVELRIFPRPIQPELPVWITCSGDPSVFARAGEAGFHCLTALLTQPLEEASDKIGVFREAREKAGLARDGARVSLMLHTFVADDLDTALAKVKEPLTTYLRSHIGLMETMVKSLDLKIDIHEPQWLDSLASFAFERYYRMGAFIGTPESCLPMVDRVVASDVDEVACLIDFGVDVDSTLAALPQLHELKTLCETGAELGGHALSRYLRRRLPGLDAPVRFEVAEGGATETAAIPVSGVRAGPAVAGVG